jgi:hypothetical protein
MMKILSAVRFGATVAFGSMQDRMI